MTLRSMSNQREHSLDNLLDEVRQLKERMKGILPSYTASLKGLSQLADEFECRFWASCVETYLEKIKADYQKYQAQAQKVDLMGKFMTRGMNTALKTGGMEPMPLPNSLRIGMCVYPSGKTALTLMDDSNQPPDAVLVTYEEFLAIAQRLKNELLEGTIVPTSEDEIPGLVYTLASPSPGSFQPT